MMLIGMHINDEGISVAGLTTENDSPVLIKDSSKKNQHTNSTPLKIYVNEGMAYVGEMVEPLLQAVPKLKVVHRFLSERDEDTDVVQAAKLLAICLKKIHHDIKVFDDSKIENILVSLPDHYTDEQKQQIQLAFELAGLPYTGCIPAAKAIACAYNIKGTANNLIISWYGNNIQLNLINEDQSICFNKNLKIIHEGIFNQAIIKLVVQQYEKATGNGLIMLHKEQSQLVVIAKQIATQFTDSACNLATATCYLNEVAVGLFITKKLFRQAIEPSIELMMTAIKEFLKEADISMADLNSIAIAGESKFFNMIIPIFEQYIANEKIYMQNPSEVFAKGTTLYLNQLNATNENIYKNANENITEEFEAAKEHVKTALINPGCNA